MEEATITSINTSKLTLSTSSGKFLISPGGITKVACWYPTQQLEIEEDEENPNKFIIRNLDTSIQEEVTASRLA